MFFRGSPRRAPDQLQPSASERRSPRGPVLGRDFGSPVLARTLLCRVRGHVHPEGPTTRRPPHAGCSVTLLPSAPGAPSRGLCTHRHPRPGPSSAANAPCPHPAQTRPLPLPQPSRGRPVSATQPSALVPLRRAGPSVRTEPGTPDGLVGEQGRLSLTEREAPASDRRRHGDPTLRRFTRSQSPVLSPETRSSFQLGFKGPWRGSALAVSV